MRLTSFRNGEVSVSFIHSFVSRLPELNDDILLHLFSYLGLKDKIKIERGVWVSHWCCTHLYYPCQLDAMFDTYYKLLQELFLNHYCMCCCCSVFIVCRRWYRVARLSWPLMRTLRFRNVFASFKGKYGGKKCVLVVSSGGHGVWYQ